MLERLAPLILAFAAFCTVSASHAQSWPTRPLRILVGFPPGGLTDVIARRMQEPLSAALGQPVVVENRPGGGGIVATTELARSADGHTIAMITSTHASAPALMPRLAFDALKDVAPVTLIGRIPLAVAVHPSMKAASLGDVLKLAKASPGKFSYATPGNGLAQHFAGELLKSRAGVFMTHVPYRGAAPAINDLVGGQVEIAIVSPVSIAQMADAGRARLVAVTGATRLPSLPQVPTVAEQGLPDFDVTEWYGVAAPASMPAESVARLNAEIRKIFSTPQNQAWLAQSAMQGGFGSPAEFGAFIRSETERLAAIARAANMKAD